MMGVAGAVHGNAITTMLLLSSNERMRGRVMGVYHMAQASLPLGFIVSGALAAGISNEFALVTGALLSTPIVVLVYVRSTELRRR